MASRKLAHALYRDFFQDLKLKCLLILMFAQNIDCGSTLESPRPQSVLDQK